jgi:hypothetical protein
MVVQLIVHVSSHFVPKDELLAPSCPREHRSRRTESFGKLLTAQPPMASLCARIQSAAGHRRSSYSLGVFDALSAGAMAEALGMPCWQVHAGYDHFRYSFSLSRRIGS